MDYIKYPPTVGVLVKELIRVCDAYFARELSEQELRLIVHNWVNTDGNKLFNGPNNFNPTVVQRLGKKRLKLVQIMLEGYQQRLEIN